MIIEDIIKTLHLIPHPEGGFYKETYRSLETINSGKRQLMTSIYFLLTSENVSKFHRIKSDELWFFHAGSPLIVHVLDASRAVPVAGNLISQEHNPSFTKEIQTEYEQVRKDYEFRTQAKNTISLEKARNNKLQLW